jgi:cytochrome c oxidase subunit 3
MDKKIFKFFKDSFSYIYNKSGEIADSLLYYRYKDYWEDCDPYPSRRKPKNPIIPKNSSDLHPFHLVNRSPWPIFVSFSILFVVVAFVLGVHRYIRPFGFLFFLFAIALLIFLLFRWWDDVVGEANEGYHTARVARGLRLGFVLFIVSEVMFFFSFFWAFFYLSASPSIFIGCQWPPFGITPIGAWGFPLINTVILLASGAAVTLCHQGLLMWHFYWVGLGFRHTIVLATIFTFIQIFEYLFAPFNISDSAFGSTFFMLTGFHGFHVLIGTIYLAVCRWRYEMNQFTPRRHVGLETAIWYWHFVDVVWLFLFCIVYVWGGYRI